MSIYNKLQMLQISSTVFHCRVRICRFTDLPSCAATPTSSIVAARLVLAVRTVLLPVADRRPWHADVADVAPERLSRTLDVAPLVPASFVRAVAAVRPPVAHEEPADALAAVSALEGAGRASGVLRGAAALVPLSVAAVADTIDAPRVRIGQPTLRVGDAVLSKTDGRGPTSSRRGWDLWPRCEKFFLLFFFARRTNRLDIWIFTISREYRCTNLARRKQTTYWFAGCLTKKIWRPRHCSGK